MYLLVDTEQALGPVEILKSRIYSKCAQKMYTTNIRIFQI